MYQPVKKRYVVNRDRRGRAETTAAQRTCQQGTKVTSHLISGRIDPRHLVSRQLWRVATMAISTGYVIFHVMALFTVFSVGNQGFEDLGNKTPSLQHG